MDFVELRKPVRETSDIVKYENVGIIGMGRIGGSLLTGLVRKSEELGLKRINVYSRPNLEKENNKVNGIIQQLKPTIDSKLIYHTSQLSELGEESDIVVVTIGKREPPKIKREDFTGTYFSDIKEIMEGLGDSKTAILMVTNPVTPNCLVAHLYSKQENPRIFGFTRHDYTRAIKILKDWFTQEFTQEGFNPNEVDIELDVLGPHGYDILVTNIRIKTRKDSKFGNPVFNNEGLSLYFEDKNKTIERLSSETVKYGEEVYKLTSPDGTPSAHSDQILITLERILRGGNETVAVDVNLKSLCKSGLRLPQRPTYMSFPVLFINNNPITDINYIDQIPEKYRRDLLNTLIEEEIRIKNYLLQQSSKSNGFRLLRDHYSLN